MAQLLRAEGQIELKWGVDKVGAVCNWTYLIDDNGKPTLISGKTRAEELDFENRTYIFDVIDGHAREKYYKTFKGKMEVTPKGEGCIMKLSLEVEKLNEDAPEPNEHIGLEFDIAKDIDAYLCST
ncbi:major latex protein 146-like [Chenopodium quinoa]|uniref:major latex protein 146-like n=1 Tax=Chenopodium quinoa TaxID=63459 RepID=UPI000B786BEB|nr:major latex protein 146-like [Chenopodium quinoa]